MRDLIKDIESSSQIIFKIKDSVQYSQNLYAALCNNTYETTDYSTTDYSVSWRRSAHMVAEIREEGCYLDWYCSGMFTDSKGTGYVHESVITDEIEKDLLYIGWLAVKKENVK